MMETGVRPPRNLNRDTPAPGRPATYSLRGRLLGFVLVAILLAAVLQGLSVYRGALQQADALMDQQLQQVARSLSRGVAANSPTGWELDPDGFDLFVQIWGSDGTQLFRSTRSFLPPMAVLGFSDVQANGNRYRVFSLQAGSQTVQIAQDLSARSARAQALALRALLPFVLLTPVLMLSVWWVISRSLAPLERARREVAHRAADDFSALESEALPSEVRPLVDELNLLFARVRSTLDLQRNFVADAAHELRSPLTALKLQAQSLRRDGNDAAAHDAGLVRLNLGIDRAIRLVEQLLLLTREEVLGATPPSGSKLVSLQDVVKLAVADVLPLAVHKQIDLGVVAGDTAPPAGEVGFVRGQEEALHILLRNLLDNAVKYTPASGQVDVSLGLHNGQVTLSVEDSGPGIDLNDRARVFDRFFRGTDAQAEGGSGLGLAIVKVIADRHGADLALGESARLGGLKVEVRFPSA